jgi:hypothetical protein
MAHEDYMKKVLHIFNTDIAKLVGTLLASCFRLIKIHSPEMGKKKKKKRERTIQVKFLIHQQSKVLCVLLFVQEQAPHLLRKL